LHLRAQIRIAVTKLLTDAQAETSFKKIVKSRVHNFQPHDLPAAVVYTLAEVALRDTVHPKLRRAVTLLVDIHLQSGEDLDDRADALALQVEGVLAANQKLGRICLDSYLTKTTIGLNGEGERRTGLCRLEYVYSYRTNADGSPA
jgi:hypothetical protein